MDGVDDGVAFGVDDGGGSGAAATPVEPAPSHDVPSADVDAMAEIRVQVTYTIYMTKSITDNDCRFYDSNGNIINDPIAFHAACAEGPITFINSNTPTATEALEAIKSATLVWKGTLPTNAKAKKFASLQIFYQSGRPYVFWDRRSLVDWSAGRYEHLMAHATALID